MPIEGEPYEMRLAEKNTEIVEPMVQELDVIAKSDDRFTRVSLRSIADHVVLAYRTDVSDEFLKSELASNYSAAVHAPFILEWRKALVSNRDWLIWSALLRELPVDALGDGIEVQAIETSSPPEGPLRVSYTTKRGKEPSVDSIRAIGFDPTLFKFEVDSARELSHTSDTNPSSGTSAEWP